MDTSSPFSLHLLCALCALCDLCGGLPHAPTPPNVDLAGHGRGDQRGAALLEKVDGALGFARESVQMSGTIVEVNKNRRLLRNRSAYPHSPTAPVGDRQPACPGQAAMRSSGTTTPPFTQFQGNRSSMDTPRTQIRTRTSASQASGFTHWS